MDDSLTHDINAREHGLAGSLREALLKLRSQNPSMESGIIGTGSVLTFAAPPELPNVKDGVLLSQQAGSLIFVSIARNAHVARVLLKRAIETLNDGQAVIRRFVTRLELAAPKDRQALEELMQLHAEAVSMGWTVVPGGFVGGIQRLDEGWWARANHPNCKVVLPKTSHVMMRSRICAFPAGSGLTTGDLSSVLVVACAIDEDLLDHAETALLSSMAADIRQNDELGKMS